MALFLTVILGVWGLIHVYVFWRLSSMPWIQAHVSPLLLGIAGFSLWVSYLFARVLDARGLQAISWPFEYLAANWIGILFLLFCALAIIDIVTLGGWLFSAHAPSLRVWAAITAGFLALVAFGQALRPPVLRDYEVHLAGLPPERDGTVLIVVSDLHLGNLLGRKWLARLTERLNRLQPDMVLVVGDLVDGNVGRVEPLQGTLRQIHAPLGVWAVTGNHEFYAGVERSVRLFEESGFQVLRDRNALAAPGLVLAGVDDLTARQQFGLKDHPLERALAHRPPGATIVLSHSPWQAGQAAAAGAGLMLCGHTHNGQIWPFTHLVALRYPLVGGRYEVGGMTTIVCRGTGTWGPRMRLWWPSELIRIRLRAGKSADI